MDSKPSTVVQNTQTKPEGPQSSMGGCSTGHTPPASNLVDTKNVGISPTGGIANGGKNVK